MTSTPADIASVQTLPQLLAYRAARTPQAEAYRAFDSSRPVSYTHLTLPTTPYV